MHRSPLQKKYTTHLQERLTRTKKEHNPFLLWDNWPTIDSVVLRYSIQQRLAFNAHIDWCHTLYRVLKPHFVVHQFGLDPERHQVRLEARLRERILVRSDLEKRAKSIVETSLNNTWEGLPEAALEASIIEVRVSITNRHTRRASPWGTWGKKKT